MMAVFFFPLYIKKHESLAPRCLAESFISVYLCQLFPSDLDALLSQLSSAGTLNSWCLNSWSGALGRSEGEESDFLLINLFFPLCPGRYLPLLCVSRACFPPRSFFSLGSFRPLAVEQLRDCLLRGSDSIPFPVPACLFSFLHQQDWCKETKSEDKKWILTCCWNYTGRFFKEKPFNCISELFVAAGKSHLGFF